MRSWWRKARREEHLRSLFSQGGIPRLPANPAEQKVAATIEPQGGLLWPWLAIAMVGGMVVGLIWHPGQVIVHVVWGAVICLILWSAFSIMHASSRRGVLARAMVPIVLSMFMLAMIRMGGNAIDESAVLIHHDAALVEVCGVILDEPSVFQGRAGLLDGHGHHGRNRSTRLELAADGVILPVRFPEHGSLPGPGDQVAIKGRLHVTPPPGNPGERDRRRGAASGILPAVLVVTDHRLVRRLEETHPWYSNGLRVRAILRGWMREAVRSLAGNDAMRQSLLAMLFLGERTEGSDELRLRFASCGLAHVLAISGLHLAILLGTTMGLLWCLVPSDSLRSIVAAVIVLGYASLLEPRTSIERAAITMGVMLLGRACGAHWRTVSVLSLVFCIILWSDPSVLMLPGFQLSFGVTAGLSLLAGRCRIRWFGLPDRLGRTRWSIIRTRLIDGFCSATVAWLVGTPIVIHHFSQCAPAAVLATMSVSIPVVFLLGMGFPLIGLVVICPIASGVGSWLLIPAADLVLLVVDGFDWLLPARVVATPFQGWVFLAEFAVLMALAGPLHAIRRLGWGLLSLCMLAAMVGGRLGNPPSPFSITALAVGNGSALLIRGGDTAVMFDAGSSSVPLVGERIIVPALRTTGVRRIDAIVVSHANLDHVSGIPELLDAFVVDRVLCSEQMLLRAWSYPGSVGSDLLDVIHERGVPIETITRGDECVIGELDFEVLHPAIDETCRSVNDESVVGMIRHRETTDATFLVCGDAQDEALARLMHRYPELQAHGMELPHHGSWRKIAAEFVKRVDPMYVLQSTGHGRYMLDRWAPIMQGRHRGVTTRDGAVELTLGDQSGLEVFIQKK